MYSNQLKLHLSIPTEFSHVIDLTNGNINRITQVTHEDTQDNYVKRSIIINFNDEIHDIFVQICEDLINYQNDLPFILPTIFIIEPTIRVFPAIISLYYEKRSLRELIIKLCKSEVLSK